MPIKNIEIRFSHWIYIDGIKFFGPGKAQLLQLIQETGSIAQAAKSMGMSYKKAWRMVDELNNFGSEPYVITTKGGQQGGGTVLTEKGIKVLKSYLSLHEKLQKVILDESNSDKYI